MKGLGGRRRNDDGGNSTWVNPEGEGVALGVRNEGVTPLRSNTQTPSNTLKRPPNDLTTTSLKRSEFPRKTANYQKRSHPTVLTHGDVSKVEKCCFSQGNGSSKGRFP